MPKRDALTQIDKLVALAQVPGLEELADVLDEHDPGTTRAGYPGLVFFLGARWITGSAFEMTATLADRATWSRVRLAGLQVGRAFGEVSPTYDQFAGLRRRLEEAGVFDEASAAFRRRFIELAVELAKSHGMLLGSWDTDPDPTALVRFNVLYADGSVWESASGVWIDKDGNIVGSRASDPSRARITEKRHGKRQGKPLKGVPLVAVSVRADGHNQRFMLAVDPILGGDETKAGAELVVEVAKVADGGAQAVVYDRLVTGAVMDYWTRHHLLPVVAMKSADSRSDHVVIPEAEAAKRPASKGTSIKTNLKLRPLEPETHLTDAGDVCTTMLYGIDGALVALPPQVEPKWDAPRAKRLRLWFTGDRPGTYELWGEYEFACPHGTRTVAILFTGRGKKASDYTLNRVLPVPEDDEQFRLFHGWRQDAENVYSTTKRWADLDGRACSFDPDHFILDAVGAGLLVNAIGHRSMTKAAKAAE